MTVLLFYGCCWGGMGGSVVEGLVVANGNLLKSIKLKVSQGQGLVMVCMLCWPNWVDACFGLSSVACLPCPLCVCYFHLCPALVSRVCLG